MDNNQLGLIKSLEYDDFEIMKDADMGNSTTHHIKQLKNKLSDEGYKPIRVTITIKVIGEMPYTNLKATLH